MGKGIGNIFIWQNLLSIVDKEILLIDKEKIENPTDEWARVMNRDFKKNISKWLINTCTSLKSHL